MTFLVHPSDTTYFRIKISSIRAEFTHTPGDKVYAAGSFDNYYEFETDIASSPQFPNWTSFERAFVYETQMENLLIAKRFILGFHSQVNEGTDTFIGQSAIDLLTLAAGPPSISLRVMSGDTPVGRVFFDMAMEEFTELVLIPQSIHLSHFREGFDELEALEVTVRKGFTPEIRPAHVTRQGSSRVLHLSFEPHYFGASMVSLMESTGIRFELTLPGCCGRDTAGHGNLLLVSNPLNPVAGKPRCATMHFSIPIVDNENVELCICEGDFDIENVPIFCQMSSGLTVDGMVVEGHKYPIATVAPPFVTSEVHASPVVDVA